MMEPKLVYQVVGRNGKVQKALESRVYRKSMSEEVSQTIHDMMKDVVSEGTGKAAAIKGKQVAGKTGTAEIVDEDSGTRNNAWFIGFVSDSKSKVAIALVLRICLPVRLEERQQHRWLGKYLKGSRSGILNTTD